MPDHLQKAREFSARKKKEKGLDPNKNGHNTQKSRELMRDNYNLYQTSYTLIHNRNALSAAAADIAQTGGPVALDTETYPQDEAARSLDPRRGKVGVISLAAGDLAYVIDAKAIETSVEATTIALALQQMLRGKTLIAHNAPFDLAFLKTNFGYEHDGPVHDTLVLDAMLFYATGPRTRKEKWRGFTPKDKEGGYKRALDEVVRERLGRELDKGPRDSDWGAELTDTMVTYAAKDAEILLPLKDKLVSALEELGMGDVVALEARFTPAMAYAMANGFAFDVEGWKKHAAEARSALDAAEEECNRLAPEPPPEGMVWAWGSSNHRKVGLALEMLGARVEKNPETGNYKTGEAKLKALSGPLGGRLLNIGDDRSIRTEADLPAGSVYIGREKKDKDTEAILFHESIWHNHFKIGRDGSREDVIAKFKEYVLTSDEPRAQEIRRRLPELADKTLACWCFPDGCHGEVLLEMANREVTSFVPPRARALCDAILKYRANEKYVTTWGDNWFVAPKVNKNGKANPDHMLVVDGRVYTKLNQLVATGRGSSRQPNMQNLPPELRQYFIAPPERKLLIADYSQMEYVAAAHLAGDEVLLVPLRDGKDFHQLTADMIGVERATAKTVNFGVLYGMGARSLGARLGVSKEEAQGYIDTLFDRAPGLKGWWLEQARKARQGVGFATTTMGRRRLVDQERRFRGWESNRSQLLNHPVQGACADGYKMAAALFWEDRGDFAGNPKMVNMIHDEFVLETDAAAANTDAALLEELMIRGMKRAIGDAPVRVEVKVKDVWEKD